MSVDTIRIESDVICPRCGSSNIRYMTVGESYEIECLDCDYYDED